MTTYGLGPQVAMGSTCASALCTPQKSGRALEGELTHARLTHVGSLVAGTATFRLGPDSLRR